jgi:hypothetical protein
MVLLGRVIILICFHGGLIVREDEGFGKAAKSFV